MVSNPFSRKKEEEPPQTLEAKLGELNVHFYTDQFFRDRIDGIKTSIENLLPETRIEKMERNGSLLSERRKEMLRMIKSRLLYAWSNVPFAKAREQRWFGRKAMPAARYIIQRTIEWVRSDADDEDIELVIDDVLAVLDNMVGLTFDSGNTSINKGVVVQTINKQDTRYAGGEEEV